jgi:hypothetical protein
MEIRQEAVMPTGLWWHDSSPKIREQGAIVVDLTAMLTRRQPTYLNVSLL